MINKPSEFKYSWLAKLFKQVPSSYQAITLGLTGVKITCSADVEKISCLNISDILVKKHWLGISSFSHYLLKKKSTWAVSVKEKPKLFKAFFQNTKNNIFKPPMKSAIRPARLLHSVNGFKRYKRGNHGFPSASLKRCLKNSKSLRRFSSYRNNISLISPVFTHRTPRSVNFLRTQTLSEKTRTENS